MLGKIISCHKREHCLFKTLSQIKYCVHRNLFWSTVCFYEKLFVMCNYFLIEYWSKIFIFLIFMFTKNGHLLYRTPPVMRTPSVWVLFVVVVQSLSCVWLFAIPWIAARQASLSFTIFRGLLKLMSVESVMPSNHLILCHPLLLPLIFPSIRVSSNKSFFASGGQSIGTSASASVLPMNIQDLFPLWSTGLISLQYKGLSRVFSNTTVQKHQSFSTQPSLWPNSHIHTRLLEKP